MTLPAFIRDMADPRNRSRLQMGVWSGYTVALAFAALGLLAWSQGLLPGSGLTWLTLVLIKLATQTAGAIALRTRRLEMEAGGLNILTDIVLMTVAIYITGASRSPLFAMYVIEIAVVAMLTNIGVTVVATVMAFAAYSAMTLAVAYGAIPPTVSPLDVAAVLGQSYLAADLLLAALLLGAPAFFTGVIVQRLKTKEEALREEETRAEVREQLRHAQKMDAVGKLAGGVAHDMNNVLGAIMSLASALQQQLAPGSPARKDVDDIVAASRRGRNLTRDLLGFARKGTYVRQSTSLNRIVEKVKGLLDRTTDRRVTIEAHLAHDLQAVHGDPSQLDHAIMNVCLNAIDAMPVGGTLSLRTVAREVTSPRDAPEGAPLTPGSWVGLAVTDTGVGMDSTTKERAFEPFFTTKPSGEGTGLGLAMVYGTITAHGGLVTLDSEPGQGTRVTLWLPGQGMEAVATDVETKRKQRPTSDSKLVLLVDDEAMVRNALRRVLNLRGLSVLTAANGAEALDTYRTRRDDISLVILDMVMPVMAGEETFHELRKVNPDVQVLLCSGHTRGAAIDDMLKKGAVGFLEKPFDEDQIGAYLAT